MPYLEWDWPKFSFFTYCIVFRVLWFCGLSQNGEAYRDAKVRAQNCANILIEHAEAHDGVLFLGHGILNRLIACSLKRAGWENTQRCDDEYWACSVFEKR